MIVRNGGREFAHFALEDVPPDTGPPSLLAPDGSRQPAEWWTGSGRSWARVLEDLGVTQAQVDDGSVRVARVLVATPGAPAGPGVLFPLGTTPALILFDDNPEIIIRGDGRITVL